MASKFKKGDVVQVVSGGPPMTIDAVPGGKGHYQQKPDEYWCRWFKGASPDHGSFGEHMLIAYAPPAK
ncbi:YodC family protein [Sphingomonas oligophenolica]|uniref:DUF2158 domain-containing protein n=1 Tax=Sphingomonas oligophenolica TaxID=301154 RepID=A0A502CJV1_9SPHN|nr:DUF2158 domain-containing protein [Sphingomonas oligophenolica]TPG12046.1 DUF2158 domain-containing protein [Sphingomonas oligophenolica]